MHKQIRWNYTASGKARLQWLRESGDWADYKLHPLAKPDSQVDGVKSSQGFHTAQHLLSLGYTYAPTVHCDD